MDSYQGSRPESRSKSKSKSRIEAAWRNFYTKAAEASIEVAESRGGEGWQSRTWEFVRQCKAQVAFKDMSAEDLFDRIPWELTAFDEEDQLQFINEWDKVDRLSCIPALEWALEMAQRRPLLSGARLKIYNQFISLAGHLQVTIGADHSIFLPTRKVAEILGLKSNKSVGTMCQHALRDGFFTLVEKGNERRSPRYRFAVERFPELEERT